MKLVNVLNPFVVEQIRYSKFFILIDTDSSKIANHVDYKPPEATPYNFVNVVCPLGWMVCTWFALTRLHFHFEIAFSDAWSSF